jgi:hypothetical protein
VAVIGVFFGGRLPGTCCGGDGCEHERLRETGAAAPVDRARRFSVALRTLLAPLRLSRVRSEKTDRSLLFSAEASVQTPPEDCCSFKHATMRLAAVFLFALPIVSGESRTPWDRITVIL